jgi:hypothetical protein
VTIVGERRFILTAITGEALADLICCTDSLDYEFIKDSLRMQGIGFEILTEQDAVKLLVQGECLAIGCYLSSGDRAIDAMNRTKAKLLYLGLSGQFGVVRPSEPLALTNDMLKESPRASSVNWR